MLDGVVVVGDVTEEVDEVVPAPVVVAGAVPVVGVVPLVGVAVVLPEPPFLATVVVETAPGFGEPPPLDTINPTTTPTTASSRIGRKIQRDRFGLG